MSPRFATHSHMPYRCVDGEQNQSYSLLNADILAIMSKLYLSFGAHKGQTMKIAHSCAESCDQSMSLMSTCPKVFSPEYKMYKNPSSSLCSS